MLSLVLCFQSQSHVQLFATPWTTEHQPPLSFTISYSLLKLTSIESVMVSNHLNLILSFQFSSVAKSCLTLCDFHISWTPALQASLSVTNSWSLLKLLYIYSVMSSNHLILCWPLSTCLQSFPASGSFLMSWPFASGGQSIEVSASAPVFPMNIQDWFPLGLTGLISLQLKGFSSLLQHHSSKG